MLDTIQRAIEKNYIHPIIYDTGYSPFNKIVLLIIILFSLFLVLKFLSRIDVKVDNNLIIATVPYIIFGSTLKMLEKTGAISQPFNYLLISPIYYELTLVITTLFIVFAKVLAPRLNIHDWQVLFRGIGIFLTLFNIALLLITQGIMHTMAFLMVLSLGGALSLVIYAIGRHFSISSITDKLNAIIIFSFLLKASSTYISVEFFGYYFKSLGIIFGKNIDLSLISLIPNLIIVLLFLWLLDNILKNYDVLRNIIKLFLIFIWMTPTMTNTFRIVLGL